MADAPNQKVLLAGFALAFVAVALVLFFMLRGGAEEAAQAPPGAATSGEARPGFDAPAFQRPAQVRRLKQGTPPPPEEPSEAPAAAPAPAGGPAPTDPIPVERR